MNNAIYLDPPYSDDERRRRLYEGQLIVYSPRPSSLAFTAFAKGMIEEAFAPFDPRTAQHEMEVDRYAAILNKVKPAFIHHPESKRLVQNLLSDLGCDPEKTYFDVPRMRSSTSSGYLTTGIAYAWHPHRDTWYSAPPCQINLWTPIYELASENAMAFHPRYFTQGVANSSAGYNYYEWNKAHRGEHVAGYTNVIRARSPSRPRPSRWIPRFASCCPSAGCSSSRGRSFLVEGGASIMFAFEHQRQFSGRWAWMLASGGVDIVLASIIIFDLPGTSAWTMGLLVGINMILGGVALIAMGLHARAERAGSHAVPLHEKIIRGMSVDLNQ